MKTYKTNKGYYYKVYKNNKRKRISKIEYDKLRKNDKKMYKGGSNRSNLLKTLIKHKLT